MATSVADQCLEQAMFASPSYGIFVHPLKRICPLVFKQSVFADSSDYRNQLNCSSTAPIKLNLECIAKSHSCSPEIAITDFDLGRKFIERYEYLIEEIEQNRKDLIEEEEGKRRKKGRTIIGERFGLIGDRKETGIKKSGLSTSEIFILCFSVPLWILLLSGNAITIAGFRRMSKSGEKVYEKQIALVTTDILSMFLSTVSVVSSMLKIDESRLLRCENRDWMSHILHLVNAVPLIHQLQLTWLVLDRTAAIRNAIEYKYRRESFRWRMRQLAVETGTAYLIAIALSLYSLSYRMRYAVRNHKLFALLFPMFIEVKTQPEFDSLLREKNETVFSTKICSIPYVDRFGNGELSTKATRKELVSHMIHLRRELCRFSGYAKPKILLFLTASLVILLILFTVSIRLLKQYRWYLANKKESSSKVSPIIKKPVQKKSSTAPAAATKMNHQMKSKVHPSASKNTPTSLRVLVIVLSFDTIISSLLSACSCFVYATRVGFIEFGSGDVMPFLVSMFGYLLGGVSIAANFLLFIILSRSFRNGTKDIIRNNRIVKKFRCFSS